MSIERDRNALQIFEAALEQTPADRPEWLTRACGTDDRLLEEVAALLAAHDRAGNFLEASPQTLPEWDEASWQAPGEIPPGRRLGDFVVQRLIGAGGMGLVYQATQVSLNRPVALKVLSPQLRGSQNARSRFQREMEAAARLTHPGIVTVFATGSDDEVAYYAMEFIDGPALNEVIEELRRAPPSELQACVAPRLPASAAGSATRPVAGDATIAPAAPRPSPERWFDHEQGYFHGLATLMADAAEAMHYAHEFQIVHRDVKPANLLLSRDGRIHISDFGLARVAEEPGLTRTGEFLGTPYYMAPEQIVATTGPVDARTDVYALGATLFELLTLRPPFCGETRERVAAQIVSAEPPPPRRLNRVIPRDLETICLRALEKQPARRYQTAREFAADLRRFADNQPILARPVAPAERWLRQAVQKPARFAAVAAIACLALLAAFFAYRTYRSESRWNEAEFARVFEAAQLASLEGNLPNARRAVDEAAALGAQPAELLLLRGQLALQSGDTQAACNQLEQAAQAMPASVAANALLAMAYSANEQHEKSAGVVGRLTTLRPSTLQDRLLLGKAQAIRDYPTALATLDEAVALDKTSVQARLVRGQLLVERAMETADASLAERGLDDHLIATELLDANPYLLGCMLEARLVAATAYEVAGDEFRRQKHLDEAARLAEQLRRFPDQFPSYRWRALYFDYVGDDQQAVDAWTAVKDRQIAYLVITLFRLGRVDEGLQLCEERLARFPDGLFTQFFRGMLLSARAESPEQVKSSLNREAMGPFGPMNAHRFGYTLDCLAGDLETARQRSLSMDRLIGEGPLVDPWRPSLMDYTGGRIDEEEFLKRSSKSRVALCQAHFFVGMTYLAQGRRTLAREQFAASARLRIVGFLEDHMSRAFAAQLERDPDWPQYIPRQDDERLGETAPAPAGR